jgi:hypothetical protein
MFGLLPPSPFRLFERLHGVCAGEHRGRVQWHELSMWQKLICGFGRYGDTCNKLGILRMEKLEVNALADILPSISCTATIANFTPTRLFQH